MKLRKTKNTYILIRHGEAHHNVKNVISSTYESSFHYPLTVHGITQIVDLVQSLPEIDLIVSSDYLRTNQTAEIVRSAYPEALITFDPRLRERFMGDFEGKSYQKSVEALDEKPQQWSLSLYHTEPYSKVASRALRVIDDLERQYYHKTIVLVSHKVPLTIIQRFLLGYEGNELSPAHHLQASPLVVGDFVIHSYGL
jgi:probable phosphoglycerate mutase